MKIHEAHPTGLVPFPAVNVVAAYDKFKRKQNNYRDRGHGCRRERGRGWNNFRYYGENKLENNKGSQINPSKGKISIRHRCGMKCHWIRICRTPDHFVKLCQASLKKKENNVEAHLTFQNNDDEACPSNKYNFEALLAYKDDDFGGLANITHLEAGDFFEDID
ncbi:uncharacterized protein [Nicotiana sylvestris]|uniref:uncharacterized protein n=1 Tax=Nicotiana sylvestris TaxID=4096 RepID=UPI00388C70EF